MSRFAPEKGELMIRTWRRPSSVPAARAIELEHTEVCAGGVRWLRGGNWQPRSAAWHSRCWQVRGVETTRNRGLTKELIPPPNPAIQPTAAPGRLPFVMGVWHPCPQVTVTIGQQGSCG